MDSPNGNFSVERFSFLVVKRTGFFLFILFILALAVRIAFSFHFQQYYFGSLTFDHKDTPTYLNPVVNLLEQGVYQGDMYLDDSKFFRVPVYPAFLGTVFLLVGQDGMFEVVAAIQCLLDSLSAILVFLIMRRISGDDRAAILSSLVYATYPFVILWNPIAYTEVLQLFFLWVVVFLSVGTQMSRRVAFTAGSIVGFAVLTKQYLGLALLIPVLRLLFDRQISPNRRLKLSAIVLVGFAVVLTPWATRNYFQSGALIILRGDSMGLRSAGLDYEAFERFANLFNENITPALADVSERGQLTLDRHKDFVSDHQEEIRRAVELAHRCGPSFVQRRLWIPLDDPPFEGCGREVIERFGALADSFWREVSLWDALQTRRDAVSKILTKSSLAGGGPGSKDGRVAIALVFFYRSTLLVVGAFGAFVVYRKRGAGK